MRGLYIHLPFCIQKCSYCDFTSYADCFGYEEEYLRALLNELEAYRGEKVDTVYLGGGTPTSLKTKTLTAILDGVFKTLNVAPNAEVTIECNPKTADTEKFKALVSSGANRLSVGVQSFSDRLLKLIGRIHTADDAKACILDAKSAGFENLSADLMFALPTQTVEDVIKSAEECVRLPINHISCYGLILEEETPLCRQIESGEFSAIDEDVEFSMYLKICEFLEKNGFLRYEISNFAKDGFYSRHNKKYWDATEYIGIGCGAHSYFNKERYFNTSDILEYIKNSLGHKEVTAISKEEAMSEFMILGLRKTEGISKQEFFSRFNENVEEKYENVIKKFTKNGLLVSDGDFIRLSDKGIYVSNTVLCEFM
ncbi:MAG: radical SAM family heme chaperone HemW [Clostridia bacterium]|nr:radical SAM family heme chaperone HemW [Clostridia bacterium]